MKQKSALRFSIFFSGNGLEGVACLPPEPTAWDEVAHVMRKVRKEVQALELAVKRAYKSGEVRPNEKSAVRFSIIFSRDGIATVACLTPGPTAWDEVAHVMRKARKEVQALELAVKRVYKTEEVGPNEKHGLNSAGR